MMQRLDISPATFREIFADLNQMVSQVVRYSTEKQKVEHQARWAKSGSAVEDIMLMLEEGIEEVKSTHPMYFKQIQALFPAAWEIYLNHFATYSYLQVHRILSQGVQDGYFRKDFPIDLVAKILLEQVNLMLNPLVFPPERYNLAQVFRDILLYYLRGICTGEGAQIAEEFFRRHNL